MLKSTEGTNMPEPLLLYSVVFKSVHAHPSDRALYAHARIDFGFGDSTTLVRFISFRASKNL